MGLDTKTYRLTDRQSQCDFDFDFDFHFDARQFSVDLNEVTVLKKFSRVLGSRQPRKNCHVMIRGDSRVIIEV
jgi:hypothetical protein